MKIRLGYVPLTDAAVVVAAAEKGFAAAEGLDIELSREASWATLRDRLALGHLDGAHILAPLACATVLGLSGPRAALAAPVVLNLNGNAVTVSNALWAEIAADGGPGSLPDLARRLVAATRRRAQDGRALRLGTVFPFSSHTYQLRCLMALGGARLEEVAEVAVVPPPHMVEALRRGTIDGFCVGAPWNSIAVNLGLGRIAALGCDLVPDCPEKVLAMPVAMAESAAGRALVRALRRAAAWCGDPGHHGELARLLASDRHLGLDGGVIRRTLEGRLVLAAGAPERVEPRYLLLGDAIGRPDPAHEAWIRAAMVEAGQADARRPPAGLYRPDLYDAAR
jgi:two-component system, oxyanion-binding sensor